jgi:beta-glucanase (GH16 family)
MSLNNILHIIALTLVVNSCTGSNTQDIKQAPTNLLVNVQITGSSNSTPNGDGSGTVNFTVSAKNATSYMVQTDGKTFVINNKEGGTVNYTYTSQPEQTGNYTVLVATYNDNVHKDTTFQVSVYYKQQYTLKWSDEFEGTSLNTNNWGVETNIHVNNELQTYTNSGNYSIADGVLTITCKKVNNDGVYGSYTSARLNTFGKKSFKYGRLEARLKLPKGKGTWPAFWMLGESIGSGTVWPKCGEIDMMEYVGVDPLWVQGSLHSQSYYGGNSKNGRYQLFSTNNETEWHIYGIIWDANKISFYVDDYSKPYYTYPAPATKTADNWPYDNNFFVILNLAFGGDWGGYAGIDKTLENMIYQIDWVRYYAQ